MNKLNKILSLALSLVLIFTLSNVSVMASDKAKAVDNYKLEVNLVNENGEPAQNVYVTFYSHLEKEFVDSGYTDKKGNIKVKYNPDEKLFNKNEVQNIDLTVYAAPQDGELVVHYLTKTYVLDDSRMSEEQKIGFLDSNLQTLDLSYERKEMSVQSSDEYSKKVFKYLKDNKKISKEKPVYKLTRKDKEDMVKKGILQGGSGDVNASYDVTHDQGSKITTIGEVHSMNDITSTFKFGSNSSVQIDVGVKSGDSWSIGGSTKKTAGWTETWPSFTTTSQTGYGKEARTYFRYEVGESISYWSGQSTYEVYAAEYNGGSAWGTTVSGDGAPASDIESGSLGSDWASHLPGATATRDVSQGKKYSGAVSFPVMVSGSNIGTVTLGVSTEYNNYTSTEFKFGNQYSKYYTYGRNSGWKQVYVSNSSR